jgi:hypothetical protein
MTAAHFAGLRSKSISYRGFRAAALHPRLYSDARFVGLRKELLKHALRRGRSHLKFGFGVMNTSKVSLRSLEFFTPCGSPAGAITIWRSPNS